MTWNWIHSGDELVAHMKVEWVNMRMDLVTKVGLETHGQLVFELKLRMRQSLGKDVCALEHGLHSSHLDLALFQVIVEPMVFDCD
jgi:hypothetical protein